VSKYVLLPELTLNTYTDKGGLFLTCTLVWPHTSKCHAAMYRNVYGRQSLLRWRYWNTQRRTSKVIFALKRYWWHQQWRNVTKSVTTAGFGNTSWINQQENRGGLWHYSGFKAQDVASRTNTSCSGKKYLPHLSDQISSWAGEMGDDFMTTHNHITTSLQSPFRAIVEEALWTRPIARWLVVHLHSNFPPFIT
jgi:hypothetical protein